MTTDDTSPAEFAWTSDGCPRCGADHFHRGCAGVLPVALLKDEDGTVVLAYRCGCGHDWTTAYDRGFALVHGEASEREFHAGAPHYPNEPTRV